MAENILEINNLTVTYGQFKIITEVSFKVKPKEIVCIAGESGCGKSTLARAIIKLEDAKSGEIDFEGKNILTMDKKELKNFRTKAQMIFQNPYSSLNPKMKIIDTLREPLKINTDYKNDVIDGIVLEKAEKTGLTAEALNRFPHEFSGGQRQRIAIARALVLNPEFILADEPVSALDVSIQAQIINLLKDLKETFNLTFLLITHDMSVIKYLADRVAIMYLGEIVEIGTTEELFSTPKHPYTKALLSSVPQLTGKKEEIILQGDLPSPANLPQGCKFHTRCQYCMDICKSTPSDNKKITDSHSVNCHLYDKISD